ncbi:unnamed protein product, partial [Rotaria socialis]
KELKPNSSKKVISFMCVPKLDVDDPTSINDIESFYILLSHEENHEHNDLLKQRLIKIEKEKLPDSGGKNIFAL